MGKSQHISLGDVRLWTLIFFSVMGLIFFITRNDQAMTQLRDRRQEAENQAKTNVLKSGFRIGVNSLLLAIGYTIIGWTGL